jgi:NTP pyrophosphatase (non-canonical NTP hydrolase)
MKLNEYQDQAAFFRTKETPDVERVLGLAEEVGEVMGIFKRIERADHGGEAIVMARPRIKKELGDVLWYLSQVAKDWNITLEEIASENLLMLTDRKSRGVLKGSGDNR